MELFPRNIGIDIKAYDLTYLNDDHYIQALNVIMKM